MTTKSVLIGDAYPAAAAGETFVYRGQLVDDSVPPQPIPASALGSLTLSIVDTASRGIVNSVSQVNILNSGRGAVDGAGNLTLTLGGPSNAADTRLLNPDHVQERRSLVLDWTYNGGQKSGTHEAQFLVVQLSGP